MRLRYGKFALLWGLILLALAGLLIGCGSREQAVSATTQELVIGIGRDFYEGPESSCFVHGSTGVWESLTYLNENLEPVPLLAERLVSDDTATVWTVHLKKGVRFHDGTPLNSDAVVKSVERLKKRAQYDEYGTFLNLERVEAAGDRTVRFTFSKPEPVFPAKVAYHGCPIFSSQSFDAEGRIVHPYGTGPFKYAEYKKGEALVLVRNDEYWGGRPKLSKVTFKVIPDPSTRLAALQTGEVQAVADVGGILPEHVPAVKKNPQLVLFSQPVTTTHYLIFNSKKPPFNDRSLRQAVSLFIDRERLVKEVLSGYGEPADTIFTPLAKDLVVRGLWETDGERAKSLAAQVLGSGRPRRPQRVEFVISSALANRWPYKTIAEILQAQLRDIGLDVEIKLMEAGAWKDALTSGEYNITFSPYTLMTGDPDFFFGCWIASNGQMNVQRGMGYSNPEADRLVETAAAERDPAKREEFYADLQRLAAKDVPLCPIYHDVCLYATRKNVRDLKLDPFFKPSLDKAWIGK